MHGWLIQLLVDRSASPFAGLRSAMLRENTAEGKHQRSQICEADQATSLNAAQRLRSTMRCSERRHRVAVAIGASRGRGRYIGSLGGFPEQ